MREAISTMVISWDIILLESSSLVLTWEACLPRLVGTFIWWYPFNSMGKFGTPPLAGATALWIGSASRLCLLLPGEVEQQFHRIHVWCHRGSSLKPLPASSVGLQLMFSSFSWGTNRRTDEQLIMYWNKSHFLGKLS